LSYRWYNILMEKDFDRWNEEKKRVHSQARKFYAHPRDIWWCAMGVNVGAEVDGKNDNFERPVLVIRVYNTETFLALPITSIKKKDKFHCPIKVRIGTVWVKLTQARVISTYRLLRKLDVLSEGEFRMVRESLNLYI